MLINSGWMGRSEILRKKLFLSESRKSLCFHMVLTITHWQHLDLAAHG